MEWRTRPYGMEDGPKWNSSRGHVEWNTWQSEMSIVSKRNEYGQMIKSTKME